MGNPIKQWWRKSREKARREEIDEIRARFRTEDINGRLWLTCDGTAVTVLDGDTSVDEVMQMLENSREAAIAFRFGLPLDEDSETIEEALMGAALN